MSVSGKTVLITGGNCGLGKAAAAELAAQGARVVFTARERSKGEATEQDLRRATGGEVHWMLLDLASLTKVRAFAAEFVRRFDELHVLVNNAGLLLSDRRQSEEGFEMTLAVNHLGPFLLTDLLLPRLVANSPARIVVVSSAAHFRSLGLRFDDLNSRRGYGAYRVYADTKLANIYFTRELARRLRGTGVTVNAVHPGVVATGFARDGDARGPLAWFYRLARPWLRTPAQGARTLVHAAASPDLEGVTGEYLSDGRRRRPSRIAQDDSAARRLWEASTEMIIGAAQTP